MSTFLNSWDHKKGENHKINYKFLIDNATDETLTHYFIKPGDIVDKPIAVVEDEEINPSLISIPADIKSSQAFFSDKLYMNIERNNFSRIISINTFFLDEMDNNATFDDFLNSKKYTAFKIPIVTSQILLLYLLKNDSLLIYSSKKYDHNKSDSDELDSDSRSSNSDELTSHSDISEPFNTNESEAFISLYLYEYKNFDCKNMNNVEKQTNIMKTNIVIGRNVLSQIIPDSLKGRSTNVSLFDYRYENGEEKINSNIADHVFKHIIPDPLSCNRFFFLAYKILYLAEMIGSGNEKHLQVYRIHTSKQVLKFDVSETTIVYLTENEFGNSVFESFNRTSNIITNKISIVCDKIFTSKPESFFLFNNKVFIKMHNKYNIWNLVDSNTKEQNDDINRFIPISKDWYAVVYKDNKMTICNDLVEVDCKTKYTDDINIIANSSYVLIKNTYNIEQIPLESQKNKSSKKLISVNCCLRSIISVLNDQYVKVNDSINESNQKSDEIINRIKEITKKISTV